MTLQLARRKTRPSKAKLDTKAAKANGRGNPAPGFPAALVLAVALIQLAHLVYFDPFVGIYGDTVGYVYAADAIFGWRNFISNYQPLYPAFVKVTMLLSDLDHFRRLLVLLQMGMVVVTCLLIYRMVLRLTRRRWLAAISALVVALDVRLTVYEYLALTEVLAVFLSVLFIYASYRALTEDSRRWTAAAAVSLLAMALTKYSCVSLVFGAGILSVVLARRFRKAGSSARLRRYAFALCLIAAVMTVKLAIGYRYTGSVSEHTGMVLVSFLSANPNMVLQLPDGDLDVAKAKAYYAANGTLQGIQSVYGGPKSAELNRMGTKLYARAVLRHPILAAETALTGYYLQNWENVLFCYPEEANYSTFVVYSNVLFGVEKSLNRALFESWRSLAWNTLCIVLGGLCLLTRMEFEQKLLLGLLLGFILYTVIVTNCTFHAFWIADNTRMHLAYEAPLIALWCFVPYRLLTLRRRPASP